jgi:hypothetical protein
MGEVARIMLRHGGQIIGAGEKLKVLEPGFMTTAKVRVLSTDRECYTIAEVTRSPRHRGIGFRANIARTSQRKRVKRGEKSVNT